MATRADGAKVEEERLSEGQKEGKLWRGVQKLYLRDGSAWTIVKMVMVTRYSLLVRIEEGDRVLMIPKHAVDRAEMKPLPPAGVSAPL